MFHVKKDKMNLIRGRIHNCCNLKHGLFTLFGALGSKFSVLRVLQTKFTACLSQSPY